MVELYSLRMINTLQVWEICTKIITNTSNMSVKRAKNQHAFLKDWFFFRIGIIDQLTFIGLSTSIHSASAWKQVTFHTPFVSPYHCDHHLLSPVFNRVSSSSRIFFPPLVLNISPSSNLFWRHWTTCFLQIILALPSILNLSNYRA